MSETTERARLADLRRHMVKKQRDFLAVVALSAYAFPARPAPQAGMLITERTIQRILFDYWTATGHSPSALELPTDAYDAVFGEALLRHDYDWTKADPSKPALAFGRVPVRRGDGQRIVVRA